MSKYWFDSNERTHPISNPQFWSLAIRRNGLVESSDRPYFPDGPISWELGGLNFNHHNRELPPVSKKTIRDTEDNNGTLIHKGGLSMSKTVWRAGKFCELRRAFWKPARCYVALKIYSKAELTQRIKKDIIHELSMLRKFKHMNILAYFGVVETKWKMYHVFEWMSQGNLLEYLMAHLEPLEYPLIQKMFSQLVSAVSYVHDASYTHRDIKLENILVGKKGDIRLMYFRHTISGFAFNKNADNSSWSKTTEVVGARYYISPEALSDIPFNPMLNDVWAMGVVLFAMLFHKFPFHNRNRDECVKLMRTGFALPQGRPCPQGAKDILVAIFAPESRRIRSYQLGDMPWISEEKASKYQKSEQLVQGKEALAKLHKTINAMHTSHKPDLSHDQMLRSSVMAKLMDDDIKELHELCQAQSSYDLFSHVRPDFYLNIPTKLWSEYQYIVDDLKNTRLIEPTDLPPKILNRPPENEEDEDEEMDPGQADLKDVVEDDKKEKLISTLYSQHDFDQQQELSQAPSEVPDIAQKP